MSKETVVTVKGENGQDVEIPESEVISSFYDGTITEEQFRDAYPQVNRDLVAIRVGKTANISNTGASGWGGPYTEVMAVEHHYNCQDLDSRARISRGDWPTSDE